jgi:hypothetical protein
MARITRAAPLLSLEDLFELEMDVVGHVFTRNAEDVQRIIFPISYSPLSYSPGAAYTSHECKTS